MKIDDQRKTAPEIDGIGLADHARSRACANGGKLGRGGEVEQATGFAD